MELRTIPEAYDPKNEGIDATEESYKLYYFIDGDYREKIKSIYCKMVAGYC